MRTMETERLFLRGFVSEDAEGCFRSWGQDAQLGRYVLPYPMTDAEQMRGLVEALARDENAWLVVEKACGVPIGYVTVDIPYAQLGIGEIGYVIGERFQHKGYASEAVRCVAQEYLAQRGLFLLEAKVNAQNAPSVRLLERPGFQVDGRLRGRRMDLATGERCDLIVCSVTRDEWNTGK